MPDHEPRPNARVVLLLGAINDDGISSTIHTSGREFRHRVLHSTSANWEKITALFTEVAVEAVIAKVSLKTLTFLGRQDYDPARERLFSRVLKTPHQLFIFEDVLSGKQHGEGSAKEEEVTPEFNMLSSSDIGRAIRGRQILLDSGLTLVPYRRRAEVTVAAQAFLEDNDNGVLFRIYVPAGRIWAGEVDHVLSLFRDYLAKVAKVKARLDHVRTNRGVLYIFYGDGELSADAVPSTFDDFSRFLDLCAVDAGAAETLLRQRTLSQPEIVEIITRYSKEARRLRVDLRHEWEVRALSIRHRLESELVDVVRTEGDLAKLGQSIDGILPSNSLTAAGFLSGDHALLSRASITINIQPQYIERVTGIVASELRGPVTLNQHDEQLLDLFNQLGGSTEAQLVSQLAELSDESAPNSGRIRAGQTIKAFLIRATDKIGELAAGVLQAYIEKKMGL
jgi:hypothetical protein